MKRQNYLAFLFVLSVLLGLLLATTHPPSLAAGLATGRPPLAVLKDQVWAQSLPPLAPAAAFAPGRLQQMHLFPVHAQSYPYPTDYWTRIVFQSNTKSGWDIFMMTPNWGFLKQLTSSPAANFSATASWEASQIAFVSQRDDNDEIYRVDGNGKNLQRVTNNPADDFSPAWAPGKDVIAFVRDVDGQEEIFRMAADGSSVMRMTNNTDRDLEPAWSPDGQQIVWAKRQGSSAALWVMNADGSDPRPLTPVLPFLQNPRWSPQGDRIAFDYDADGDGLNELAMMNADGSDLHTVYDAQTDLVDLWLGDWSPDGDRLLFSVVLYIVVDQKLYIQDSVIVFRNLENGSIYAFDPWSYAAEMLPVWRKLDHQPPVTSMDALPAWSGAPIKVSWQGQDRGRSGIRSYDVQVREGTDGPWQTWLDHVSAQQEYYHGLGGQSYYFRVRARDRAGNVEPWPEGWQAGTTVENLPPQSTMQPLQAHERKDPFVQWSGTDPGGSGISTYDVQYRLGEAGEWTDWLTHTWGTGDYFRGDTGIHYYFRVRAHDRAENVEPWPEGDGNTDTIIYGWKLAGAVRDVRGQPVPGVQTLTTPAGFETHDSDATGVFTVYGHSGVDEIGASWQKPGYGFLPSTSYPSAEDVQVDVVLPSFDNQVRDGDFEAENLSPSWTASPAGVQLSQEPVHSGSTSLLMGCTYTQTFAPLEVLSDTENADRHIPMPFQVGEDGTAHLLWERSLANDRTDVLYARRDRDGDWLPAEHAFTETSGLDLMRLAVDHQNAVHVLYAADNRKHQLFYVRRSPQGQWSAPQAISDVWYYRPNAVIGVDGNDTVHIMWTQKNTVYYRNRSSSGAWSDLQTLASLSQGNAHLHMRIDNSDRVHVEWGTYSINYRKREPDGSWTATQQIAYHSNGVNSTSMQLDAQGVVHFVWIDGPEGPIFYAALKPDGSLIGPLPIDGAYPIYMYSPVRMAVGKNGQVHFVWRQVASPYRLVYLQKRANGSWMPFQVLPFSGELKALTIDDLGRLHLVWQDGASINYAQRGTAGNWSGPMEVYHGWDPVRVHLAQEGAGRLHLLVAPQYGNAASRYTHSLFQDWPAQTYTLSQPLSVPPASAQPTLSLFYRFQGVAGSQPSAWQVLIDDGVQTKAPISVTTSAEDWQHAWADMMPWAGQTVTLTLHLSQAAGSLCTHAWVDELSLGSYVFPDLWVRGGGPAAAPGERGRYVISYGNQGDAPAAGVRISTTLPLSLTLLAAEPAPVQDGRVLRWDLSELDAHSGPFSIIYTSTIAADIASPNLLTQPLHIASETAEPLIANNEAELSIFVPGFRRYWPLIIGNLAGP